MTKPTIALCMGDAAGIGPELVVKVLAEPALWEACRPLVIADPRVMRQVDAVLESGMSWREIKGPGDGRYAAPTVDVLRPKALELGQVRYGEMSAEYGGAAAQCLQRAYELTKAGVVQGVISAPLNKEAFHLAGYDYADELEWLADLTHSSGSVMMGLMRQVWTVAVAEHVAFADILSLVTRDNILDYIRKMHLVLRDADSNAGRIGVSALNIHAGDGGLHGREELDEIGPAVAAAVAEGIDATGPVPADIVFAQALAGRYDGVVAMHHDQANIARKLQPMSESATLFVGLPVYCGTTAHGTAFDIAGQGIAAPGSLMAATMTVARLAGTALLADG